MANSNRSASGPQADRVEPRRTPALSKRRFLTLLGLAPAAAAAAATPKAIMPVPLPSGPLVRDWNGELWVVLQANVRENLYGGGVRPGGPFYLVARPDGGVIVKFDDRECRQVLMHRDSLQEVSHG